MFKRNKFIVYHNYGNTNECEAFNRSCYGGHRDRRQNDGFMLKKMGRFPFSEYFVYSKKNISASMAFGTGSAVAHRVVDAVMGPCTIQHEIVVGGAVATDVAAETTLFLMFVACTQRCFQDVCLSCLSM